MGRSSWAASVVTTLALTACSNTGGGGHATDTATTASTAPATTTTAAPTTTTTLPPPPYSFDGSVPPPELINTGTDYEAIFRTLDAYDHWLRAHNPDESKLTALYATGTATYEGALGNIRELEADDLRYYESASDLTSVDVVSVEENAVTLRAHYTDEFAAIVRRDGSELDRKQLRSPSTFVILLVRGGSGTWHIASSEVQQ